MFNMTKNVLSAIFVTTFIFFLVVPQTSIARPIVGAIRWDAWVGDDHAVGATYEADLDPNQWHCRVPFYGEEVGPNEINANGDSQQIMDQEIAYAKDAGLDYWAFVMYPTTPGFYESPITNIINLYLNSAHKSDINFCAYIEAYHLGRGANPSTGIGQISGIVQEFKLSEGNGQQTSGIRLPDRELDNLF